MNRLRLSIQTKILLGTVVAIAVMAVFVSVANVRQTQADLNRERRESQEQAVEQALTLVQSLDASISSIEQLSDTQHFQNMEHTLIRLLGNVRQMTIRVKNYDTGSLEPIASTELNIRGTPPNESETKVVQENAAVTAYEEGKDGEPLLYLVAPVHLSGTVPVGTVEMRLSLQEQYDAADARYNDRVRDTIRNTVIIALLAAGIAVAIGWGVARAIVKPVRQLTRVAEQISMGEMNVDVPSASNDEIGDLADSFQRMVTAVKFLKLEADTKEAAA